MNNSNYYRDLLLNALTDENRAELIAIESSRNKPGRRQARPPKADHWALQSKQHTGKDWKN